MQELEEGYGEDTRRRGHKKNINKSNERSKKAKSVSIPTIHSLRMYSTRAIPLYPAPEEQRVHPEEKTHLPTHHVWLNTMPPKETPVIHPCTSITTLYIPLRSHSIHPSAHPFMSSSTPDQTRPDQTKHHTTKRGQVEHRSKAKQSKGET
jgi:hypothetical protein